MKIVLGSMDNFNQQGLPEPTWAGTAQANPANPAGTAVNDNVEQSTIRNDEQSTHRNVEPTGNSGEAFSEAGTGASTPSSIVLEPSRKISTASAVSSNEQQPNPPDRSSGFNNYNTTVVSTSTSYKYRDYSSVADAEGLDGYYSDASDPPPSRRKGSRSGSVDGNDAAPALGTIQDAHTMRLQKFPAKLESILSRHEWSDIVCWMPHGRSWKILKHHDFETLIMPLYFDHCNYHSFNRLVNAWSFRRISSGPDRGSYYHEVFLRGRPDLSRIMRRLPKSQKKAPMSKRDEPDFYAMPAMAQTDLLAAAAAAAGTRPGALAAAARNNAAMRSMNVNGMAMVQNNMMNGLGNINAMGAGVATNDVSQLSLMGGAFGMFPHQQPNNAMGNDIMDSSMNHNLAIQAAMARMAQQQHAERAQMTSMLQQQQQQQQPQSFIPNDFIQPQAQMQHYQAPALDQQLQQDSTSILEANLRATQLEHDRLQQQIAALQSQQRQMANEQLQLPHFQLQQQQQQLQQHQPQLYTEASLGLQQAPQGEPKMASPVLGEITSAAGIDGEVGNSW